MTPDDLAPIEERQARVRQITRILYPHLHAVDDEGTCDDCERRALVCFMVGRFTVCRSCAGLRGAAESKAAA